MTVWSAADVAAAAADGSGTVRVGARDVVTPLAKERARELGVRIETAGPGAGAAPGARTVPPTLPGGDRRTFPSGTPATGRTRDGPAAPTGARSNPGPGARSDPGPGTRPGRRPRAGDRPGTGDRAGTGNRDGGRSGAGTRARNPLAAPPPPPVGPPSGALFRRGAPLPPGRGARGRTGRVAVVGAGHVGMITAMRLAEADVFDEVVLVDIDAGRAAGIALDLTHTAPLAGFATRVRGVGTVEEAGRCDYAVITAGKPRQPGMSRSDLIGTNAAIVGDLAARLAAVSPHVVLVVVTNPLDEMTQHAWRASGLPSGRVLGMAGVLDTARFQALASLTGVARADRIEALALGSHGEEMVVPLSRATADGRPLAGSVDGLDAIVDRTRGSGAEVVGLLASGSAFLAPGMSAARMVLAMAADSGEVMPAAVLADGQYGIRDVYVGLPVRLGRGGVVEIVELALRPDELAALRTAADRIRERLADLATAAG